MMRVPVVAQILIFLVCAVGVAGGAYWGVSVKGMIPGIENCRFLGSGDRQIGCVVRRANALVEQQGASKALAHLDEVSKTNEFIAVMCHPAMHRVARARFTGDVGESFAVAERATGQCAYGYSHGIIEVAAQGMTEAKLYALIHRCVTRPTDMERRTCAHGVGHGLRRRDAVATAATECTSLIPQPADEFQCLAGVFMEDAWRTGPSLAGSKDLNAPCRGEMPDRARLVCNASIVRRADAAGVPLDEASGYCNRLEPKEGGAACAELAGSLLHTDGPATCLRYERSAYLASCFNGMARVEVYDQGKQTPAGFAKRCAKLREGAEECATGLGRSVVDTIANQRDVRSAVKKTCASAFPDPGLRSSCRRGEYDLLQGVPSLGAPLSSDAQEDLERQGAADPAAA